MIGHQTWAPIVFKLLVSRKLRFSQFVKVLYPCVCLVTWVLHFGKRYISCTNFHIWCLYLAALK